MKTKLLILIVISGLLIGCSLNKNSEYFKSVAGTYKLISVEDENGKSSESAIKKIKNKYSIVLKEDGTAILYLDKRKYELTYDKDYLINIDETGQKQKNNYKYINGTITVYFENSIYKFSMK